MLALLIYCYANGTFSSRQIERATYRDLGVRFVAANLHPDHDTIAVFRRSNKAAFEAAFLQVLLMARESGLLHLGTVSIDGTKIDANASKIRSVHYDRTQQLRAKLASEAPSRHPWLHQARQSSCPAYAASRTEQRGIWCPCQESRPPTAYGAFSVGVTIRSSTDPTVSLASLTTDEPTIFEERKPVATVTGSTFMIATVCGAPCA
jgi:hypothetical protein